MTNKNEPTPVSSSSKTDANRDPLTGAPGAHLVGTGLGAAGGGAVGAAVGSVAGPVGMVAGAAIGAVAGGLTGKGVAEVLDPSLEDKHWRENFSTQPYAKPGYTYDDYGPAYKLGWERASASSKEPFAARETELGRDWDKVKGTSRLTWETAKDATRAAWQRTSDAVERLTPGDSDHDGK
jgi:hypothetical protein